MSRKHLGLTTQFPSLGMGWPGRRFIHFEKWKGYLFDSLFKIEHRNVKRVKDVEILHNIIIYQGNIY